MTPTCGLKVGNFSIKTLGKAGIILRWVKIYMQDSQSDPHQAKIICLTVMRPADCMLMRTQPIDRR